MTGGSSSCSCHHNHSHKIPVQEKGHQKNSKEEDNEQKNEEETETTTVPENDETDVESETEFETETDNETETDDSENIMELDSLRTDHGVFRTVRGLERKWKKIERESTEEETSEKNWWERVFLKLDFETKLVSAATLVSILVLGLCTIKYIYS